MKLATLLLAILLSGCIGTTPLCDSVAYVRQGTDVNVQAHCTVPVGKAAPVM